MAFEATAKMDRLEPTRETAIPDCPCAPGGASFGQKTWETHDATNEYPIFGQAIRRDSDNSADARDNRAGVEGSL